MPLIIRLKNLTHAHEDNVCLLKHVAVLVDVVHALLICGCPCNFADNYCELIFINYQTSTCVYVCVCDLPIMPNTKLELNEVSASSCTSRLDPGST